MCPSRPLITEEDTERFVMTWFCFETVQRAEQAPSQEVPAETEPVPSAPQLVPPPKKEEGEAPSTPQLLQPPKKEEGEAPSTQLLQPPKKEEGEETPSTPQLLQPPKKEEGEETPSTPQLLQPPKKEEGEEGEILSASPSSPAAKPMGKCYMDLEEGEVVGEGKEESKTESRRPDRWAREGS